MSFQLTRTHTSVVLAATTIAASLVVIPTLAEGANTSEDAFCNSLSGAQGRITAEYNPLLASYAAAAAGNSSTPTADPAREAELRAALADAQAALDAAQQAAAQPGASAGNAAVSAPATTDRGLEWGAYGTTKNPMQAADTLFDQWKNSSGHDKNMLAQNNVVGVGVHIAKHGQFTRIYGTQKFYAITGGSPDVSRFHTTGAYGFDGGAFNSDNTNYVSGLAGGGDAQRANSWQNKVGALPGVALPVDVSTLPAKSGSAAPSTPAPSATGSTTDNQQAFIDAQASVNAAQSALDEYLASVADEKPAASLAEIDAELDRVADSIAAQTSVHPEKDGGVTVKSGDQAGRYLTAAEYRDALTRCTTLSVSPSDPAPSQSVDQGSANPRIDTGEQTPAPQNPSVGDGQTPAPQNPTTQAPAPQNPSVDGGQTPAPGTQTPEQTRRNTLAATGASGVWVGVGAVAVLVAGIGAVVASRRAKR